MTGERCYKKVVSIFLNGQQKRHIQCSEGNTTNLIEKDLDMQEGEQDNQKKCMYKSNRIWRYSDARE